MSESPLSLERFKLKRDYRASLPPIVSRFIGYRPPGEESPHKPLPFPPFSWLVHIPLRYEVWLFAWVGSFGAMLLIEAIMSSSTAFRDDHSAPLIVTSFGASAVLVFAAVESPLSQPRNLVLGHFVSALIGTAITRLWALNPRYHGYLDNQSFHGNTFVNGALSMATSALGQLIIGAVHPPAGATGLNAAVLPNIVSLSWWYLPTVLVSSLVMLGWALLVNNLGRRRYPMYWWAPGQTFVRAEPTEKDERRLHELEETERGLAVTEGHAFDTGSEDNRDNAIGSVGAPRRSHSSVHSGSHQRRELERGLSISEGGVFTWTRAPSSGGGQPRTDGIA
ncbi:hypothetical protein VTK73DRAFT_9212 [Phialemonium thermophilum]|uniref:HPP transmembrane region domain-containing protein n=1 Tax=Phialemonium thermophilum TaxID=223376 RepID=A0ABR3W3R6_9PEZI